MTPDIKRITPAMCEAIRLKKRAFSAWAKYEAVYADVYNTIPSRYR
jgi:hypothetical protein